MSAGCSRPFNWFSDLSFRSGYYQIFDTSRCTRQDALEYFLCPNFVVTETVTEDTEDLGMRVNLDGTLVFGMVLRTKNRCFQIVVLKKTFESPLDCKDIKPVNSKGDQPRTFIGRTDAEAKAPILQPPDVKS